MGRNVVIAGITLIGIAIAWPWLSAVLDFGDLPGDLVVNRPTGRFYLPFTTGILICLMVGLVLWLFRR